MASAAPVGFREILDDGVISKSFHVLAKDVSPPVEGKIGKESNNAVPQDAKGRHEKVLCCVTPWDSVFTAIVYSVAWNECMYNYSVLNAKPTQPAAKMTPSPENLP